MFDASASLDRLVTEIDKDVLLRASTLSELNESVRSYISDVIENDMLFKKYGFHTFFNDDMWAEMKYVRRCFGDYAFISKSDKTLYQENPSHFSITVLRDLYRYALGLKYSDIHGYPARRAYFEVSSHIDRILRGLSNNSLMKPSLTDVIDVMDHPEKGDFLLTSTAAGILGDSERNKWDLFVRWLLSPGHIHLGKGKKVETVNEFDLQKKKITVKRRYTSIDNYQYNPTLLNRLNTSSIDDEMEKDLFKQVVYEANNQFENFSSPNDKPHKQFKFLYKGKDFQVFVIPYHKVPTLHEMVLMCRRS